MDVRAVVESVRRRVSVVQAPAYDQFENSFLHIFAGGYDAGYYGYAWAEVLAADAFSRFEEEDGIWSQRAAHDFRENILAKGGSVDFMELFVAYRGRKPTPDALFAQAGLA
jgi:oligopeptidase A